MPSAVDLPGGSWPNPTTLGLVGLLALIVLIAAVASALSGIRRHRRDAASLAAIEFVRVSFASRLARGEPMDELLLETVEALHDSFRLDRAEIWTFRDGTLLLSRAEPARPSESIDLTPEEESIVANARVSGTAWARAWLPMVLGSGAEAAVRIAPMSQAGQLLGVILAERSRHRQRLADEADPTLEELAREVGVAIHKRRLDLALQESLDQLRQRAEELRASRARVVAAADAERRRIERDLHDGAQNQLVGLALKARLVGELVARDPARAEPIADQLVGDAENAIEELRTLAHGIYPPLLASDGLEPALRAACQQASISARLSTNGIGRHRAEVEAAVYFCCMEALQNSAKHAGEGATAVVRVWQEDGALLFEVGDNGHGFALDTEHRGAGLANMQDRLGAVGGTLRVESAAESGTWVLGNIPVETVDTA
jgi:signal transduction histidine kinase